LGKRRTRILIETEEILVSRKGAKSIVTWCRECQAETMKVTVLQAALLCQVDQSSMQAWIQGGQLHVSQTAEGDLLICVAALGYQR
jgi:hypothetical protein